MSTPFSWRLGRRLRAALLGITAGYMAGTFTRSMKSGRCSR